MPDNAYMDEHGVPRLASGHIDHDEWRLIAIEEKLENLQLDRQTDKEIQQSHERDRMNQRICYNALPWWAKLWDGI